MSADRLSYLFDLYIQRRASGKEEEELMDLLDNPANKSIALALIGSFITHKNSQINISAEKASDILNAIFQVEKMSNQHFDENEVYQASPALTADFQSADITPVYSSSVHRIRLPKTAWFRNAAAAIIILTIGSGAYFFYTSQSQREVVQTTPATILNDVAAPTAAAPVITLPNGKRINLGIVQNGTLISGLRKVSDGQISYDRNIRQLEYHTLTVPRGSEIVNLTLGDGSKVWLNAGSSLRYPTAFTGVERRVDITGEAYFEVAKDPKKKFIVSSAGLTTEALGTHFNVNSYPDEQLIKVTLLEGSVKVSGDSSHVIIKPGSQATLDNGILRLNSSVDVDQVMAWKNGHFKFGQGMEITAILRQVSRWYDVDIQYEGKISGTIGGSLSRQVNVSKVLDLLQSTGSIRYKINGKQVIVSPSK